MPNQNKKKSKKVDAPRIKEKVLKYFLKNPKKRMNAGQLSAKLRIKATKPTVHAVLIQLRDEDILRQVSENKFVLNKKHKAKTSSKASTGSKQTYEGKVDMIKSGAAYILVDGLENDVYVPEKFMNGAMNGDDVLVSVSASKRRKPEGKVKKITKRNTTQVMGELTRLKKKLGVITPSSARFNAKVYVAKEDLNGAEEGDKVLLSVKSWPEEAGEPIWTAVKKVFKNVDPHNWTMESILVESGFSSSHTPEAMKEAEQFPSEISEKDIETRRDFRDILTFTIDPDTAQDFDDAISYQKLENGDHEIGVHIADVTHFLKPGTKLDQEAFERSTSVYLVDRCIPMLPERLSNHLCSLMPNVDRLVFSAVFTFAKKSHEMTSEWFGKGIIHSDRRFTYDEGQESLDDKAGLYHKELNLINKVAYKLRKQKFKEGAINFETDEVKFILDEKNKPTGVYIKQRKDVHLLIEDFMLLANKRVARFVALKEKDPEIPFVYRIHDLPDQDKLAALGGFMKEFGIDLDFSSPEKVSSAFNSLSKKAKDDDTYKLMMLLAIRTMSKAVYSTNNIGHYGLSFEHYSHFTSPIRRYSDVLTHRLLEKNLTGKPYRADKNKLEAQCIHISAQERKAMEAERNSIKYKQVEYMSDHIGEEFVGLVSGMIERGVFIELTETKAEGFIPFTGFKEKYTFISRYKANSRNGKKSLRMGDKINVKVTSTDLDSRQIELEAI